MAPKRLRRALASVGGRMLRTRRFVRAPIALYKVRLGVLFGARLLMMEHIGRNSGARRYVVLEVVSRPTSTSVVVASGFGARAQWYRNVVANPHVRLWIGSRKPRGALATPLSPTESAAALSDYANEHPRSWAMLRPVFEDVLGSQIARDGTTLPLVRLDIQPDRAR